jgi:hypothetical protein
VRGERYDLFFDIAATRPLAECRRVLEPNGRLVITGAQIRSHFLGRHAVTFLARVGYEDLIALIELTEAVRLCGNRSDLPRFDRNSARRSIRDERQARAKVVIKIA